MSFNSITTHAYSAPTVFCFHTSVSCLQSYVIMTKEVTLLYEQMYEQQQSLVKNNQYTSNV